MVLKKDEDKVDLPDVGKVARWWIKNKNKVWTTIAVVAALVTGNSAPSVVDSITPEKEIVTHESQETLKELSEIKETLKGLLDKVGESEYNSESQNLLEKPKCDNEQCECSECSKDCQCGNSNKIPIK